MAPKLKQFDVKQLTLKQRILMSNLLMIAVPVTTAAITTGVCALVLGMLLFRGADLDANLEILEDPLAFTLAGSFARGQLKLMLAAAIGLVLVAVLVACVLASRAGSRLVTEHIEAQLRLLGEGLGHLAAKDLAYRLPEDESNEFMATARNFNAMASRLEGAVTQLEEQDARRRQLLANVSHDLRSPLTAVRGYAEALRDGVVTDPGRQAHYLDVICTKADQMDAMAEQVFEFSKVDAEGCPAHLEEVDLLAEAAGTARSAAEAYEGALVIDAAGEPCRALVDRTIFVRVVQNLVENCAKYRSGDVAHVHMEVEPSEKGCRIAVFDDGPGVPEEELERIFEPFYRADAAREHPEKGSGLGLAFVRSAVALMGGAVHAEAAEPQGLAVIIELPGAGADANPGAANSAAAASADATASAPTATSTDAPQTPRS